jgi:hypothetical protein
VTILDDEPASDAALLSEASLSDDWNRPEEDAAWAGKYLRNLSPNTTDERAPEGTADVPSGIILTTS